MIKFGIRNNLLYPFIFSLTVALRKIIIIALLEIFKKEYNFGFLMVLLKFIFEFIIGGLFSLSLSNNSKLNVSEIIKEKGKGIKLIHYNKNIKRPDNEKKNIMYYGFSIFDRIYRC